MPSKKKPIIFISYSHQDIRWVKRLVRQLNVGQQQDCYELWDDRRIAAGENWYEAIVNAIEAGRIAIILISPSSLTSNFILSEEVPRLLKRRDGEGLRIFPIIVEHCDWENVEWLSRMQLRPDNAEPLEGRTSSNINKELAKIAKEIRVLAAELSSTDSDDDQPPPDDDDGQPPTPDQNGAQPPTPDPNGDQHHDKTKIDIVISGDPISHETTIKISISRLPGVRLELFGRERELKVLDNAWADPDTNIVSLTGLGGLGKSALINYWLRKMKEKGYGGAERVYGWSFYRQGTSGYGVSAVEFIKEALRWFGNDNPGEHSEWGKGQLLAELVNKHRTLLILDGLEPLQQPPRRGLPEGILKEPSMKALLFELAEYNRGLCVITSRQFVSDLTGSKGEQVRHIKLKDLSPEAGAELLKARSVVGSVAELRRASAEFDGHPLALTLLGNYLRDAEEGQIARRDKVDILEHDEEEGGHARRVMASYERWFKEDPKLKKGGEVKESPELAVLRMIALFDRPADGAAINALRRKADIPHLTEPLKKLSEQKWRWALVRLRAAGLIAEKETPQDNTLDAHPLVREYFKKQLKAEHPDAWLKGNDELFNFRRRSVKVRPDKRDEIDVLYAAIPHGCQADRHKRAFREVYFGRIQQDKKFFAPNKLGTVSNDLDALACFFDAPEEHPGDPAWKHPVKSITGRWRALLFGQAGYRLWMLGRLREAITPMTEALNADVARAEAAAGEGEACEAWNYASVDADTLGSIYLNLGELNEAISYSHLGVKYAFASGDKNQIVSALSTLADVLHHKGYLSESREIFAHAAQIKGGDWLTTSFPHSLGHRRRDLLLSLGEYPEVQRTAERILQSQEPEKFTLIDLALLHLSLGQAHLFQAAHRETTHYALARHNLTKAMDELRRAGRVIHLPRGRLALAKLHLMAESWPEVKTAVDEALGTAVRGLMELHQADCHLSYARLYLAQGETEKAGSSLAQAEEIIGRCGYRPREVDVHLLHARLRIERNEKEQARRSLSEAKMLAARMGYRRRDRDLEQVEELLR